MAGSYRHLVNDDLQYTGLDLIENGGDAAEAIEKLYGMVCWLASQAAVRTGRTYAQVIEDAEANWKTGIALAGDARERGSVTVPRSHN
jgi:hypothetical protein